MINGDREVRIAIFVTHPIQYYSPLFRELSGNVSLHVFYGQLANAEQQSRAGFGVNFEWDVDLMCGYTSTVLTNLSRKPNLDTFGGCDVAGIDKILRDGRFDAVIVFGWYQKFLLQAIFAAKKLGIPVMVRGDSHLGTPRSVLRKFAKFALYQAFLRVFDAALYVGSKSQAYYSYYKYPRDRLFFSPHCVDTEWFRSQATDAARRDCRERLGVSLQKKLVLFSGKLVPFKRPLDFIASVAKLRRLGVDAEAMIAGAGPMEADVRRAAADEGLPLHMLGFCNQSMMPSIYAAADVLVLPSTGRETWGLVCNEALACGTPIVVSDQVGCAPDLAADNCVGYTFPVGDCAALAVSLKKILSNPPPDFCISSLSERYSTVSAVEGIKCALNSIMNVNVKP